MHLHLPLLTDPTSLAGALAEAQTALGSAHAARQAARRRWRDSLLGNDLAVSIQARAALGSADVAVERAEALVERLTARFEAPMHAPSTVDQGACR